MVSHRVRVRPRVRLATDEIPRGPWVYARQVRGGDDGSQVPDGALVEVLDASGRFVGHALHNGASDVRLRWLSRGRRTALDRPADFVLARLRRADRLRRRTLRLEEVTDAYRVAHAEGDDLPGLIVDRLGSVLVCELHALGFRRLVDDVDAALGALYPGARIVHRIPRAARAAEGFSPEELLVEENGGTVEVVEHGIVHVVRPGGTHKTGFFCDQRDNRRRVAELCGGRDVLDLCCNTGGFALHAARAGARRVCAVDLDEEVLELARAAVGRNGASVELRHADAFDVLREVGSATGRPRPEVIVLDPPKLIAGRREIERGLIRYGDLNTLALGALAPGGLLASFSCSGALDLAGFLGMLFASSRRARRDVRLLEILGAAPDHPQRPDWPRSRYLKGALLAVD